jgi:hypothetical protein
MPHPKWPTAGRWRWPARVRGPRRRTASHAGQPRYGGEEVGAGIAPAGAAGGVDVAAAQPGTELVEHAAGVAVAAGAAQRRADELVPRQVTSAPLPATVSPGPGHDYDGPLLLRGQQRWNIVVPREREQGSTGVQDGAGGAHGDRGRPVVAGRDPSLPVTRATLIDAVALRHRRPRPVRGVLRHLLQEGHWSRPILNWSRPLRSGYQHRFSTRSGNDGKYPGCFGQTPPEWGPPQSPAERPAFPSQR